MDNSKKILIVGGGGREHALAWKLKQSSKVKKIYIAPGNAGTAQVGENVNIPATDILALADFAEKGNINWIGNMNVIIAVLKDSTLYFSQTGRSIAFLVRDSNVINIGHDLVSDLKPHPLKTFSNIANGQIDVGDKLIFATSRLIENIDEKEIKDIFTEDPGNAIEQFENRLKGSGTALVFIKAKEKLATSGAVSIRKILSGSHDSRENDDEDEKRNVRDYSQKHPSQKNRLDDIIGELNNAERETELGQKIKFVARVIRFIVRNTKRILGALFAWTKRTLAAVYNFLKPRMIAGARGFGRGMSEMSAIIANRSKAILSKPQASAGNPSGQFIYEETMDIKRVGDIRIQSQTKEVLLAFFPNRIKNIPAKGKIAFAGIIILAIVAIISVNGWMNKNKENENKTYYAAILDAAKKSEIAAESSLIYENKTEAAKLIRETLANAERLISAGYFTEEAAELQKKATTQMDKLDFVTRIDDPVMLVDFAANSQSIKANGIFWSGKNLYTFNSANNALYRYDFAQKTSQIVAVNSENMGHLKNAKPFGLKTIFLTDSPGTAVYDPAKSELKNISIKLNPAETNIADIDTFGSNLYVLDKNDANIYKHILTAGGYAKGEKWLLAGAEKEIKDPVSLSIDGDVYLLQNADNTSAVLKFSRGARKELTLEPLLIPLKNATKIVAANVKHLYILDPENKRVVIMTKDGKLSKQITSGKFDNLIDFAVNPNEKTIYLLNGTTAYEVEL